MALDAGDIRVAAMAHVYLAPVGTAFPTFGTDPDDPWMELGFITTDGITISVSKEVNEIMAMQSLEPVRVVTTKAPKTVAFAMMQEGRDQLFLALGGGTITESVGPPVVYKYEPPDPSVLDERAMIVEFIDGAVSYRWCFARTQNREGVEHKLVNEDAATFPVTQQVLQPIDATVKPFYIESDDPALAAA